jgi:hypothetical protein
MSNAFAQKLTSSFFNSCICPNKFVKNANIHGQRTFYQRKFGREKGALIKIIQS